jgi:peptidoglycan/xylan/chitin deacetylase (PgdA/CDA1 family)
MRRGLKQVLAKGATTSSVSGCSLLIYHRAGGGSVDERDVRTADFERQLDCLRRHDVISLDDAADRLAERDEAPTVVLTFDDGFEDVYRNAWPLLRERALPFTIYLATAFVGGTMHWEGSTAKSAGAALTWDQIEEMVGSGQCTIGNHTHSHARPQALTTSELDRCSDAIEQHTGQRPGHFAYTWGVDVPAMHHELRVRFRTAATGRLGRNRSGTDPMSWKRIPVRRTDPLDFFRAKLTGSLGPECTYAAIVQAAKRVGLSA